MDTHPESSSLRTFAVVAVTIAAAMIALLLWWNAAAVNSFPIQDRFRSDTHNQPDPFRVPGCIGGGADPCAQRVLLPAHAGFLLAPIHRYVAPARGHAPNEARTGPGTGPQLGFPQGRHVRLAIDTDVQRRAQLTADCYTGQEDACRQCNWCNTAGAQDMYGGARAERVEVLVANAASSGLLATASAHSACFAARHGGVSATNICPALPFANTRRPNADLGNQALATSARPGSITKIPISMALTGAGLSERERAELPDILTHSLTEPMIDLVMCRAQDFDPDCAMRRLRAVADMAQAIGWVDQMDVIGGTQLPGLSATRFAGRLMRRPGGSLLTAPAVRMDRAEMRACSRNAWRNCRGAQFVDLVAELFGTGDALLSPVGAASALLHLASAANGRTEQAPLHLVTAAQQDDGRWRRLASNVKPAVTLSEAKLVIAGLERVATHGTAASACRNAAKATGRSRLPCAPGKAQDQLQLAMKSGTPVMSAESGRNLSLTLSQWRAQCERFRSALLTTPRNSPRWHVLANNAGKCNMPAVKWVALMLREPGSPTWDKVVIVVAERNWNRRTQLIDTPNDRGPNVAAEIGMALVNGMYPLAEQLR